MQRGVNDHWMVATCVALKVEEDCPFGGEALFLKIVVPGAKRRLDNKLTIIMLITTKHSSYR